MQNHDYNLEQLEAIALALGDLLPSVTFVGGSTTMLLVDQAAYFGVRRTDDIDVIIDIATLVEYHKFGKSLRKLGFYEDKDGPICRWIINDGNRKIKLDVMPIDEAILGFSNRWYKPAIDHADEITLPNGTSIKRVNSVYFIATKFEAFAGRGDGDYFSHDLEDIVFVMENRKGLMMELMSSTEALKHYFSQQASLLLNDNFLNILPGLLNHSDSALIIEENLNIMLSWKS